MPPQALDPDGEATLELFRENDAYTEFLWERLAALSPRPVEGRILEIGCGIGNLTRILLRSPDVTFLHAIDLDPGYVERVRRELVDPRLEVTPASAEEFCPGQYLTDAGSFDVIVSSNVLEHVENHARALENVQRMLRSEGVALVLVPAHPFLYSTLDRTLSHFRRYRREDIQDLAQACGLRALRVRYFNPLAGLGWWWYGKILRREMLPPGQLSFYARFAIPISRIVDRLNPFPFGVSLLAVLARRN